MDTVSNGAFDADWVVVGSGFGGSVSALRLAEKGYDVTVLEQGRRIDEADMPRSTWDLRRYFFAPSLGMRGLLRMRFFRDVTVAAGAGVGGGSLGYANTLYVPPARFFEDPQWADLGDWERDLAPHYAEAERMLGVVDYDEDDPADALLQRLGEHLEVSGTWKRARVGVFLGEAGTTVADPYFGGDGPARTGCTRCGRCMVGCPVGAKNTLRKNYLWFAERLGVDVRPDAQVVEVRPLGAADGSDGYAVTYRRPGLLGRRRTTTLHARGVVLAGGALGTNELLQRCRLDGALPRVSPRLGELVRTNSEAILGVTVPEGTLGDLTHRVAITSSIYPDPDTHIETVTYGHAGGAMKALFTVLVGKGTRTTRPLKWLAAMARHPRRTMRFLTMRGWSRNTIIVLVMQTLDNAIALRATRTRFGRLRLQTEQDPERPNPTFIPVANQAAEWMAEQTGGIAQSSIMEAVADIPSTAHILGGAVIARSPQEGVVDRHQRVFGYHDLLVCDGSAVPANPGVNPSLTITALAEHAMSHVPPKGIPASLLDVLGPADVVAAVEPEPEPPLATA
ncbi:GMC oxidoreductase [Conexibacter sp. SYSU D00693]|uniref:GMC oxidoreductase n=1 Tax=Conexibacter sp. SYSU D00693 TaxID=2812560 RepID=UPI00196B3787|nr:GMC family oxidoreductase [Conexibacter sp. SYSU D00693]